MTTGELAGAFALVALVVVAAVLAMAETSLTHLGRGRAAALEEEGVPRAGLLKDLLEHRERALNPILLLVLACHLGIAFIVAVLAENRFGMPGLLAGFALTLVIIFVVAEALPKTWALHSPDRAALAVAPFAHVVSRVAPLRWATRLMVGISNLIMPGSGRTEGPTVSEEELLALAGVAVDDAVLDAEERELIEATIEFSDTVAREVMVPRPDMVTVGRDFRIGDVIEVVILNGLSRLPVSGEGIDDIVGVVHAKDLMRAERDGRGQVPVTELLREAFFVPETKKLRDLLREMRDRRTHLAIVVDEYGGTAGLVTLEDLLEELVGDIVDEYDIESEQVTHLDAETLSVAARMNTDDLAELLGCDLPEGDWDSVGGLLIGLLGHVPSEGESAEVEGHHLVALHVNGRRVDRVAVRKVS